MDIGAWLRQLGLERYEQVFLAGEIDQEVLPELTDSDLRELGIPLGPRKKLLRAIEALTERPGLSEPRGLSETTPAVAFPDDGERRQVTVLFCDISGFTRLSGDLGAEATHRLLDRYFGVVDGIIQEYGGRIDKHIGDGVMAVFGAPIAHDDDPLRSVRAALDIHPAIAILGHDLGHAFEVHVGIATGEVVASSTGSTAHRAYTVTGDSVNLASRLEGLARPGQTLVSEAVWRALDGRAQGSSQGAIEVKGLRKPVPVWRVQALRQDNNAKPLGAIVGRHAEVGQFTAIVRTAQQTGNGQVVHVRGDAGIGKTRLVQEFQAIASSAGFSCHNSLVLDFGTGKGRDAIRSLVRDLVGLDADADEASRNCAANRTVAEHIVASDRRVFLDDLLDLPQPPEQRVLFDAMDNAARNLGKHEVLVELVENTSRRDPLCLWVEDLHWADQVVLAGLSHLVSAIASCPALLIMTSRFEGDPMRGAWREMARSPHLVTFNLGPLRESEARHFADGYSGIGARFIETCIERAEGNPLFLDQLLRSADIPNEERLPGSLKSVILARLDRLALHDKRALQAASVLGQKFTADVVQHLVDMPEFGCTSLIDNALVRPFGDAFLFTHALIRDGVYGSLLEVRRCELHRRAADWFAERDLVLNAEHLDRAADERAASAYLAASEAQAAEYHFEAALKLAERGLALAKEADEQSSLSYLKAKLLLDLGLVEEATIAFRGALDFAETALQRCDALLGLAGCSRISDAYDKAFAALDEAERVAAANDLTIQLTQIHNLRGNLCFPLGRIEECLSEHQKSLEYALTTSSAAAEAQALSGVGDAEYARGRLASSHQAFCRCVELCQTHGLGHIEVGALMMVSGTLLFLGAQRASLDAGLLAIEAAARVKNHRAELNSHICVNFALIEMGLLEDAEPHFERTEELVQKLGARRFEAPLLAWRGRAKIREGDRAAAATLLRDALRIAEETGPGYQGASIAGMLAVATSDPEERRRALQTGENRLAKGAVSHNHLFFYPNAIDASLAQGEWSEAERYANALDDFARHERLAWADFHAARGRALAAWGRGQRGSHLRNELERLQVQAGQLDIVTSAATIDYVLSDASTGPTTADLSPSAITR